MGHGKRAGENDESAIRFACDLLDGIFEIGSAAHGKRNYLQGSDIVGLCGTHPRGSRFLPPSPAGDLGHIVTVPGDELLVVDELVADRLLGVSGARPEPRHAVDDVAYEVKAIEIVQHAHTARR